MATKPLSLKVLLQMCGSRREPHDPRPTATTHDPRQRLWAALLSVADSRVWRMRYDTRCLADATLLLATHLPIIASDRLKASMLQGAKASRHHGLSRGGSPSMAEDRKERSWGRSMEVV